MGYIIGPRGLSLKRIEEDCISRVYRPPNASGSTTTGGKKKRKVNEDYLYYIYIYIYI
jgi:hypothetical protein